MAADKDDFLVRMKMEAEDPASQGPKYYADLMKTYGPLWITTDSNTTLGAFSPHGRVLTQITGPLTADGSGVSFTFFNPKTGASSTESFADFLTGFEQEVIDNKDLTSPLTPQVVHFIDTLAKGEGFEIEGPFDIHEPIHENITMAALINSAIGVPAGTEVGKDQAVNEFLRGVLWNDDPAVLMFNEDADNNWNFSTGAAWGVNFERAKYLDTSNKQNLTGRSHFFDLQFLHAMATQAGEDFNDTRAKILLWAEVMYRLSIGEGVQADDRLDAVTVQTIVAGTGKTYMLSDFFDQDTDPKGSDTLRTLLTRDTQCKSLQIRRRAIGSVLHLVEDSYARGHVKRTLTNPGDLVIPGQIEIFKPGKYGLWGAVLNFHCYKGQKSSDHDRYDKVPDGVTLDTSNLGTFDGLLGARDAIAGAIKMLDYYHAFVPWTDPGGPKEYLEDTVFKLDPNATPADNSV
jgi:hypothetical protein